MDALFIDPEGHYPQLLGVEHCWDAARDARGYAGAGPVVAHPPCNLWVNLAAVNWVRYGKQLPAWYPDGSDGGCFAAALAAVRRCGGVLEHPAFTHAWDAHNLPRPRQFGWQSHAAGEWVCEVYQSAYGHRAQKRTWLFYAGQQTPFDLNWAADPGTHQIGWFDRSKPALGKREASASPIDFALELIALAAHARR